MFIYIQDKIQIDGYIVYVLFTDKIIYVRTMNTDHSPEREGFTMKSFVL